MVLRTTTVMLGDTEFIIDERYQLTSFLGSGAYGVVAAVYDSASGQELAVKKIEHPFGSLTTAKRTLRELRLLKSVQHPNLLSIVSVQQPENYEDFTSVYLFTDKVGTDLKTALSSGHFSVDPRRVMFQLLSGLKYLHQANVVHRDVSPKNVLVNSSGLVKLCDFGLARSVQNWRKGQSLTDYVVSRWYRAPELLLRTGSYSAAVDMWSAGVLWAELVLGQTLLPGRDTTNQLHLVLELIGKPTDGDLRYVANGRVRERLARMKWTKSASLKTKFADFNPLAFDLLQGLLAFTPQKRLTAAQALEHPYFADLVGELQTGNNSSLDLGEEPGSLVRAKELLFAEIQAFR